MSAMSDTTMRPVDRYLAGVLERMRATVALSRCDDASDVPADVLDALDYEREQIDYPQDAASEAADSMVYSIERLGVIEDDGTVGELRSVELLLGGGGPTITLTVKLRDGRVRDVELWHSWGDSVGNEATARTSSAADDETVEEFLGVLGGLLDV